MLARPQTEALLEIVSVVTLPGDLRRVLVEEKPSERVWLPPLKLLLQLSTLLLVFFLPFLVSVETVVCFFYTMHVPFYTPCPT